MSSSSGRWRTCARSRLEAAVRPREGDPRQRAAYLAVGLHPVALPDLHATFMRPPARHRRRRSPGVIPARVSGASSRSPARRAPRSRPPRTYSGLTSRAVRSGPQAERPRADAARRPRPAGSRSVGGPAAVAAEQPGRAQRADRRGDVVARRRQQAQRGLVERLDPEPAQADREHEPPLRVPRHPDQQLDARRSASARPARRRSRASRRGLADRAHDAVEGVRRSRALARRGPRRRPRSCARCRARAPSRATGPPISSAARRASSAVVATCVGVTGTPCAARCSSASRSVRGRTAGRRADRHGRSRPAAASSRRDHQARWPTAVNACRSPGAAKGIPCRAR